MKLKTHLSCLVLSILSIFLPGTPLWAEGANDLRVSDNGRFLIHPDGTGFFAVADTAWAIAWKLTREDVEHYLQHRKEQGFNTVALVAFPSYEGLRIEANAYGDYPFEVREGAWNPERPITTPGENSEDPEEYDYWDHLQYIIDVADAHGLAVILLPAWGGSVAGSYVKGEPTEEIVLNSGNAYGYGRWIGRRFHDKKNVIWMIGGDRSAVYGDRDYRPVFRAVAEGVADGVNNVDKQDLQADYGTTIMSYHPRKWHPNSSEWFHNDPWLDFNSIQDQPTDQNVAVEHDYRLSPAKPTWLFEGGYEARTRGDSVYRDWQIRFQSYQTVFAGGFGITYGSMNVFHFDSGVLDLDEPVTTDNARGWKAGLDEPGAIDMRHLVDLMATLSNDQFLDRIPDQTLIDGDTGGMDVGEGVRSSCLQATRGANGDYAMVYSANGRNIRVKMDRLSPQPKSAYWFNPRNGQWRADDKEFADATAFLENIPSGPSAPIQEFDPPDSPGDGNDWILVLKDGT
ncbi:MAG: hypothetical protein AMXMBFR82_14920 [Candidatus Hydrogenedentota bacterium]